MHVRPRSPRMQGLGSLARAAGLVATACLVPSLPAAAESVWAVISLESPAPAAVGSADLRIDFDPGTLSPLGGGEGLMPTEVAPLRCTPPVTAPCASAIDDGPHLAAANVIAAGQLRVSWVAPGGLATAGDIVALPFDAPAGTTPTATLTFLGATDATANPLAPGQQPALSVRFVPEPGAWRMGGVAIASCLALRARRRSAGSPPRTEVRRPG